MDDRKDRVTSEPSDRVFGMRVQESCVKMKVNASVNTE